MSSTSVKYEFEYTQTHTFAHTFVHECIYGPYMDTCAHTKLYIYTCMCSYTLIPVHTYLSAHTYMHVSVDTHLCTHTGVRLYHGSTAHETYRYKVTNLYSASSALTTSCSQPVCTHTLCARTRADQGWLTRVCPLWAEALRAGSNWMHNPQGSQFLQDASQIVPWQGPWGGGAPFKSMGSTSSHRKTASHTAS